MYVLHDVLEDQNAAAEFQRLGGRLPPLLVIGDRVVEGFNPEAIEEAISALPGNGQEEGDGRQPEGEK